MNKIELHSDDLTAGYYLVVNGHELRPQNGIGTWTTHAEALEWWADLGECLCTIADGGCDPECRYCDALDPDVCCPSDDV